MVFLVVGALVFAFWPASPERDWEAVYAETPVACQRPGGFLWTELQLPDWLHEPGK